MKAIHHKSKDNGYDVYAEQINLISHNALVVDKVSFIAKAIFISAYRWTNDTSDMQANI